MGVLGYQPFHLQKDWLSAKLLKERAMSKEQGKQRPLPESPTASWDILCLLYNYNNIFIGAGVMKIQIDHIIASSYFRTSKLNFKNSLITINQFSQFKNKQTKNQMWVRLRTLRYQRMEKI